MSEKVGIAFPQRVSSPLFQINKRGEEEEEIKGKHSQRWRRILLLPRVEKKKKHFGGSRNRVRKNFCHLCIISHPETSSDLAQEKEEEK